MVNKEFGITGIGNSIVDIIVQVEDDFLLENDLRKGMMSLVDLDGIQNLEKKFKIETTVSGGSVANSIVCMSLWIIDLLSVVLLTNLAHQQ